MKVTCKDREKILRDVEPTAMAALESHAIRCAECARELELWRQISLAARAMHKEWESPHLWPQIHQALAEQAQAGPVQESWWRWSWWQNLGRLWQSAAALLLLVALTVGSVLLLVVRERQAAIVTNPAEKRLLTERAARDVEDAETKYIQSIENLAKLAEPRLENAGTPLMASYREKLLLIDSAIAELHAQVEQNRLNAHLRRELLSLYQEKQQTLQEVLREE